MTTTPHQWYGNNDEIRARLDAETDRHFRAHEMAIADPNVHCDPKSDDHLDNHTECDYLIAMNRYLAELEN